MLLQNKFREDEVEQAKVDKRLGDNFGNKKKLQDLMEHKEENRLRALAGEKAGDQQMIDAIVNKIQSEDKAVMDRWDNMKKINVAAMEESFILSSNKKAHDKWMEEEEVRKMMEHQQSMDDRKAGIEGAKAEEERKKMALYKKLEEENVAKRKTEEKEQKFKEELYEAMHERNERAKELDIKERAEKVQLALLDGKKRDEIIKKRRLIDDKVLEEEFNKNILAKFAEDDRLEIYSKEKKRQILAKHKETAERLW